MIDRRLGVLAFGDSTWLRRGIPQDPQMTAALDLLRRGTTQRQLLALAGQEQQKKMQE